MDIVRLTSRKYILEGIIAKGSLYAVVARFAIDSGKEDDYILECYEQAHVRSYQQFLGKELFDSLIHYNSVYYNKPILIFGMYRGPILR